MTDEQEDGVLIDDILVVDKVAEVFILGCTVDYVKEFGGSYLKVVNPNATDPMWVVEKVLQYKIITDHQNIDAIRMKMLLNKNNLSFTTKGTLFNEDQLRHAKVVGVTKFPTVFTKSGEQIGGLEELESWINQFEN